MYHSLQVIPLARRSGLIEWCEGTVPLGEWLASDTKGAHQRYRPTDLSPNQAKMRLAGARDKGTEKRHAVFTEVCSKIQYVLAPIFFIKLFNMTLTWRFPTPVQTCARLLLPGELSRSHRLVCRQGTLHKFPCRCLHPGLPGGPG